jgi:hypothetical protein
VRRKRRNEKIEKRVKIRRNKDNRRSSFTFTLSHQTTLSPFQLNCGRRIPPSEETEVFVSCHARLPSKLSTQMSEYPPKPGIAKEEEEEY